MDDCYRISHTVRESKIIRDHVFFSKSENPLRGFTYYSYYYNPTIKKLRGSNNCLLYLY